MGLIFTIFEKIFGFLSYVVGKITGYTDNTVKSLTSLRRKHIKAKKILEEKMKWFNKHIPSGPRKGGEII